MDGLEDEDDEEVPLIGDDPTEPPEATALDRSRLKAIAKRIARKPDADINVEDRGWLEQTPQMLPVITESLVDAASAAKRDEPLVAGLPGPAGAAAGICPLSPGPRLGLGGRDAEASSSV